MQSLIHRPESCSLSPVSRNAGTNLRERTDGRQAYLAVYSNVPRALLSLP